jgi:hypothetical protein
VSARVVWAGGGEARLESIATDAIVLRSTVPAPPGSRVEGVVTASDGEGGLRLRVKVHACRRLSDGLYRVSGRPLDLHRTARERLEAMTGPADGFDPPPQTS